MPNPERTRTVVNLADLTARIDEHTRYQPLPENAGGLFYEVYKSGNGALFIAAHSGEQVPISIIRQRMNGHLEQEAEITKEPVENGFSRLYKTAGIEQATTVDLQKYMAERAQRTMIEIGVQMGKRLLAGRDWDPKSVYGFDLASSMAVPGMATEIAKRLGLREDVEKTVTALACASSAEALGARLEAEKRLKEEAESRGETYKQKRILLISLDPVSSLMPPGRTDKHSYGIFSDGEAGAAYIPNVDMEYMAGHTLVYKDTKNALSATPPYTNLIGGGDELIVKLYDNVYNEHGVYGRLPTAPEGYNGYMDPRWTTILFLRAGTEDMTGAIEDYIKKFSEFPKVDFANIHHPAIPVFDELQFQEEKLLEKNGHGERLRFPFQWVVPDGNSSGSTFLIALARSIKDVKPGDLGFLVGFGAGAFSRSFFVRWGYGEGKAA